jgi:HEPN domain-containing protein
MKKRPSDRGLIIVARANINEAKRNIKENDEVYVNFAMFNTSQAAEKTMKYLCSCNGIDYDYSHYLVAIADKLVEKNVIIPPLVLDTLPEYGMWATRARYNAAQLAQRSYVNKHIICVDEWIASIEKQLYI